MKTINQELFLCCAYCLTPLRRGQSKCNTCGGELLHDPGVEMTEEQYRQQPRKACPHCGKPVMLIASTCYACKRLINDHS